LKYAAGNLKQRQGIQLAVQSFDYNLLKLQFTLRGVVLKRLGKEDFPPFFQASQIKLKVPLALILGRKLQIQELDIQNSIIDVHIGHSGKSNIPFQAGSKKTTSGRTDLPEFIINRFILEKAQIFYSDEARNIKFEFHAIHMQSGWLGGGRHYLNLEMGKRGSLQYQEMHHPIDALNIKAELDYGGIDFKEFNFAFSENELNLSGRLDNFSSPLLKVEARGELDLDSVRSVFRMERALSGKIHFRSALQGPLDSINAQIHLQSSNIQFERLKNIDLKADLRWENDLLSMTSVHIKMKEGEVQGRGEFHPLDWKAGNKLSFRWESISLENFRHFYSNPYHLASRASGSLEASWADFSLDDIKGRAEIHLYPEKQRIEAYDQIPLSGLIVSRADSGNFYIDIKSFSIPGAEMKGEFRFGADRVSGKFKIDAQNLKKLTPNLLLSSDDLSKKYIQKLDMDGRLLISGELGGSLTSPRIKTKLKSNNISIQDLRGIKVDGTLIFDSNSIRVNPFLIQEDEGKIEIFGLYPLGPYRKSMDFDISGKQLAIERLVRAFNAGINVEGRVDWSASIKGKQSSPIVNLSLRVSEGLFYGEKFDSLDLEASYKDEEIKIKSFHALKAGGRIEAQGQYNLRKKEYNARLAIDSLDFQGLKIPRISEKLKTTVNFNLKSSGTLQSPHIEAKGSLAKLTYGLRELGDLQIQAHSYGEELKFQVMMPLYSSRLEGSLQLKFPSSQGLNLNGEIDLSFVSSFFADIEARGILQFHSQITGAVSDLELSADLSLPDADLVLTRFPLSLEDIKLHFKVLENMMNIESFSFRLDRTQYDLKGNIPLETLPVNLPGELHVFEKRLADIIFTIQNFDPSVLSIIFPNEVFKQISGQIDGIIKAKAPFIRLNEISAEAHFDKLELDIFGIQLSQQDPTHFILNNEKLIIQRFILLGDENRLSVRGSADISENRLLDVYIDGELELKMLGDLVKGATFSGKSLFDVHVLESIDNPRLQGSLEIQEGRLQTVFPRLFLDQLNGKILLDQDRIRVEKMQGDLNGGKLELFGDIGFSKQTFGKAEIILRNQNALFDFPKDLYSQITSELRFISDGKKHFLDGTITVVNAKYTEQFRIESAIFRYLRRGQAVRTFKEPNEILSNLYFNVTLVTANKFLIDNNISKSELIANLKLTGTAYNPALAGRAEIEEGGEIYFSKNTFHIERGTVDFVNPSWIEPDLNLMARTRVDEYDIQMLLTGTPDRLSASLISDPPLSEPNIISLLVTGRTLESASASVMSVAGNKALSYINSAITGKIEQAAAKSLGLESVRIDASLVSTEENPGARITVGQHIIRDLELIFSQDLKDAQNRTWITNYAPIQNVNLKAVKRDDNTYNFGLQHELRFGLQKSKRKRELASFVKKDITVEEIRVDGHLGLSEKKIREQIKLAEGKRYNFYKFEESLDRILRLYRNNNYLDYTLKTKKEEINGRVTLIFYIDSGPRIILKYKGGDVPKKLKKEIVDIWIGSSFSPLVLEDIKQRIRLHFLKKRFYQVKIHSEEFVLDEHEKVIVFHISKGVKYEKPYIVYKGNRLFSGDELTRSLRESHLISDIFANPNRVKSHLENLYAKNGYLSTKIGAPIISYNPEKRTVHVNFALEEGPRFKVDKITVNGSQFFGEKNIIDEIDISPGDILSPERLNEAHLKIREAYVQKGFNDVQVQSQVQIHRERGLIDLIFDIEENQQGKIVEILISGNSITQKKVIQRELLFKEGDAVQFQVINETRKRLYDLGIFERVNIEVVPIDRDQLASLEGMGNERERPYRVEIDVVEFKPYRMRYGLQFDTESSFGASGDLVNHNLFGNAQLLGTSFRINRDERDIRGVFRSPYFFSKKINTEFFTFFNRSIKPSFKVDRLGFTFQQQIELSKSYILSYNYTFERNHTFDRTFKEESAIDSTIHVGSVNAGLIRDTRDNILNATRGMFFSQDWDRSLYPAKDFLQVEGLRFEALAKMKLGLKILERKKL